MAAAIIPYADAKRADREGLTAMMMAAQRDHAPIVSMLLQVSDFATTDILGKTALDHATGASKTILQHRKAMIDQARALEESTPRPLSPPPPRPGL
jgi:hypothetical protein